MADERQTDVGPNPDSGTEGSVILASYRNRRGAEHMLAALGRGFRKKARKGSVDAFVVSTNRDGSLKVTESRVLSASAVVAALMRVSLAMLVGFVGLFSGFKGARAGGHAARGRQSHVGSDERAKAILDAAGPHGTAVLVRCQDPELRDLVMKQATERATATWEGPREEFLTALDPGTVHDWVRTALGVKDN